MNATSVTKTLEMALAAAGLRQANVVHRPRLRSDNGPGYIARDSADWLDEHGIGYVRGAPNYPQIQGKIERWHQTLKIRLPLESYDLPGELEAEVESFVGYYNHPRYNDRLNNLTHAGVYLGRGQTMLLEWEKIERKTFEQRRLQHDKAAA